MKRVVGFLLIGLFLVGLWLPVVSAAPEIRPLTDATQFVSATDTFSFVSCSATEDPPGTFWELTAPSGASITFTRIDSDLGVNVRQTYTLDGVFVSGDSDRFLVQGEIVGEPADGTFSISSNRADGFNVLCSPSPNLQNHDANLVIGGKTWNKCDSEISGLSHFRFWNRHITATVFNDGTPQGESLVCLGGATVPDNDPNNFRFFSDQGSPDPDPDPFTADNTLVCPSSATISGLWIRGATQSGNTFVRFAYRQGPLVPGDADLRDDVGVTLTGLVDDGGGASGDHSALAFYNNVVGTSYQFLARAGASGSEQLGGVVFITPGRCDVAEPSVQGFVFDPNDFQLTLSHAQCRGDLVEFELNRDPPEVGSLNNLNVTIVDGKTNLAVMLIDDSQMFFVTPPANPRLLHFNRSLSPGPYVAVALEDNTVSTDRFMGRSFNVPSGDCGVESNLQHIAQGFSYPHCHESDNCASSSGGGSELQLMDLSVQESWTFLFLFGLMVYAMKKGWPWVAGTATLAIPMVFVTSWIGGNTDKFIWAIMMLVIVFWVHYLTRGGKSIDKDPYSDGVD